MALSYETNLITSKGTLLPPLTNIYWAPLYAKHLFSNEDKLLMIQALKKTS